MAEPGLEPRSSDGRNALRTRGVGVPLRQHRAWDGRVTHRALETHNHRTGDHPRNMAIILFHLDKGVRFPEVASEVLGSSQQKCISGLLCKLLTLICS